MKYLYLFLFNALFFVSGINSQSLNYDFSKLKSDINIKFVTISKDTVGFYKSNAKGELNSVSGLVESAIDTITFIFPLDMKDLNQIKRNGPPIQNIKYEFNLTSDYLKQSAIIRERAIKTELYTKIIGLGLAVIGGATLNAGLNESNQQSVNYGSGLILAGGAVSFIGWCVAIDLNLESNRILKQSSKNNN
jgi:hypothetical protein